MKHTDLTAKQVSALAEQLRPHQAYFYLLEQRMYKRAFPDDDEIVRLVKTLHRTAQELAAKLHQRAGELTASEGSQLPFGMRYPAK